MRKNNKNVFQALLILLLLIGSMAARAQTTPLSDLDALRYIASHPDLIAVFGADTARGRAHYEAWGIKEGRKITFEPLNYTASHPDLINAFGVDESKAATHYIQWGFREQRKITFEPARYMASHADLIQAFAGDERKAATHFIQWGFKEKRQTTYSDLDALQYVASFADLIQSLGADVMAGIRHYVTSGFKDGRKTVFDAFAYIASYGDLISAFGSDAVAGARHYINWGYKEGRQAAFDVLGYLSRHSDLQQAFGTDTAAATKHYINWGFKEGRALAMTVTVKVTGPGTASQSRVFVNSGERKSVTFTPSSGAVLASVSGCGGALSGNVYTTGVVSAVCEINATFRVAVLDISITSQPQNATVNLGQVAAFSVTATGTAPLTYQWRRNGSNITGATSSTYTTPVTVSGDNGAQFSVVVGNSTGNVTSNTAVLTVKTVSTFTSSFKVFQATSASGPWTTSNLNVSGADAGLVDPAPILMPDNSILMYYLMSYVTNGDPAASQPNNEWKFGVAKSTDHGVTFVHQRTVFTYTSSATDPFPLRLATGGIRLLSSHGASVKSVTTTDPDGLSFPGSLDVGTRTTNGGVPGALRVGNTYFLYVCSGGSINYLTSSDGLNFAPGGTAIAASGGDLYCDPSPIDDGGGRYLMAYKRLPAGAKSPVGDEVYIATSTDGRTWTSPTRLGTGSVPGLVKTANGVYRIFATSFP